MKKWLLITIDCDLRTDDVALRQASLDKLLQIFDEAGLAGHITWFLNENDFLITKNHGTFLEEALRRGDTLGVHDHFDSFEGILELGALRQFCGRSKRTVEEWLAAHGGPKKVIYHRNGSLAQHPNIYLVLKELRYTVLSDVWPGNSLRDFNGCVVFDNRSLPPGIQPYRHDVENIQGYRSERGHFLQFPVTHVQVRDLNYKVFERWQRAFSQASAEHGIFLWAFHPYEILTREHGTLSRHFQNLVRAQIDCFANEYQMSFISMAEGTALVSKKLVGSGK